MLIYAFGKTLKFQAMNLPESIKKYMTPQFKVSEHKYSPVRVQEAKRRMNDKINRDLDRYYQYGTNDVNSNLDPKKQVILQMLTLKYN